MERTHSLKIKNPLVDKQCFFLFQLEAFNLEYFYFLANQTLCGFENKF